MIDRAAMVATLFRAMDTRDIESAAALLHPDVDWQDALNGGRLRGPDAVRAYWRQVHDAVSVEVSALTTETLGDDRLTAVALFTVRDRAGKVWGEDLVTLSFIFRDGLLSRMDIARQG